MLVCLCVDLNAAIRHQSLKVSGSRGELAEGRFTLVDTANPEGSDLVVSTLLPFEISISGEMIKGWADTFGLQDRELINFFSAPQFDNDLNFLCKTPSNLLQHIDDGTTVNGLVL